MNYLLLQDGSLFKGEINGDKKNILGEMILQNETSITIHCPETHNEILITNTSDNTTNSINLSDIDFQCLKEKIKNNRHITAKLVADSLPIEFHLYDLKTCITLGLNQL